MPKYLVLRANFTNVN